MRRTSVGSSRGAQSRPTRSRAPRRRRARRLARDLDRLRFAHALGGAGHSVVIQQVLTMSGQRLRPVAAAGLVIGALLGLAGSFVPSADLRGLARGVDGTAIVVGSALLTVHHAREGNERLAALFGWAW